MTTLSEMIRAKLMMRYSATHCSLIPTLDGKGWAIHMKWARGPFLSDSFSGATIADALAYCQATLDKRMPS